MTTGRCAVKLERGVAPERGTIAALVALGGLGRRGPNTPCAKVALAFGNKIALTADHVSIETTCASALPTRSRSSWEPYNPCANVAQGLLDGGGNLEIESQEQNCWRKHPIAYSL